MSAGPDTACAPAVPSQITVVWDGSYPYIASPFSNLWNPITKTLYAKCGDIITFQWYSPATSDIKRTVKEISARECGSANKLHTLALSL